MNTVNTCTVLKINNTDRLNICIYSLSEFCLYMYNYTNDLFSFKVVAEKGMNVEEERNRWIAVSLLLIFFTLWKIGKNVPHVEKT